MSTATQQSSGRGGHRDHDSICAFRQRFLKELQALFTQLW